MIKKIIPFVVLSLCLASAAFAQTPSANPYPNKPIRLIVPFPPGGGSDILARLIASKLGEKHKWTFVIENKPGAGGTLGITEAIKAQPGGYDLVIGQKDNLVIGPWLYKNLKWDPSKDLVAVAHIAYSPVLISTGANSKYKSLGDVVTAARKNPDAINYGSPGNGTSIHLAAELFQKAAKIEIAHVPYKGSSPALLDAGAGNIELLVSSVPSAIGQIKGGALRPLAVTSAKRSTMLPDVPTVAESGIKNFDVSTWYGLFAPAGTPANVVTVLNTEINKLLNTAEVRAAIQAQGAEPVAMTPANFASQVKSEYVSWKSIVESSGARID